MTNYMEIALTPTIMDVQKEKGSFGVYGHVAEGDHEHPIELSADELDMIVSRDSFYMATVSETGWPYVQHRGGDAGFVRQVNATTIGWVERSGNRQYLGTGNITATGKIAAIFVDYPTRTRLKLFGKATYHPEPSDELVAALGGEGQRTDGAITVKAIGTNWNCPKYITPRFTEVQVRDHVERLQTRVLKLEAELKEARDRLMTGQHSRSNFQRIGRWDG